MKRKLRVNAFNPMLGNSSPLGDDWIDWATGRRMQDVDQTLDYAEGPDLREWTDKGVGWGIVLPENEALSPKERARPLELPKTVQEIFHARRGVVMRYRADLAPLWLLRYYEDDGRSQQCRVLDTERGIGVGEMPQYLLILASPEQIPWRHQYVMAARRFVGRLDLPDAALENYFVHLASGWQGSTAKPRVPLLWSVDWEGDITELMRYMIAEPTYATYLTDDVIKPFYAHGAGATSAALFEELRGRRPGMIVTTSHGCTSPFDDVAALRAAVGVPVDQNRKLLDITALLKDWQPDGAIWYAHACCSAGTDKSTSFAGLFDPTSDIDRILQGATKAGARVAPLPTALLSAEKPARAFVGHVEPTFNWPLQDPATAQPLSESFSDALTKRLYARKRHPIGSAFAGIAALGTTQFKAWQVAKDEAQQATDAATRESKRQMALLTQLAGLDWQGVVIIGDPTVAIAT